MEKEDEEEGRKERRKEGRDVRVCLCPQLNKYIPETLKSIISDSTVECG
jgi:hypothetical protein